MTIIITLATTKGGAGKTTLAACLATYWEQKGYKIGVVDSDTNENLCRWLTKGKIDDIAIKAEADENAIIDVVEALSVGSDIVLIDTAGFANQAMIYAIGISTLVIIPSRPSEDDVLEAIRTKQIVTNAAKLTRRDIPYKVVLTQVKQGTTALSHTHNQFSAFSVSVFKTEIVIRTVFEVARYKGVTPLTHEPSGKAAKELKALAREIENCIPAFQEIQINK